LSMITPPVAMAVYAASAIANSDPNKTGFYTWKMAIPIFFIPYFFVYSPGMAMIGAPLHIIWTLFTSMIGVSAISSGLVGYLKRPLKIQSRSFMIIGGFLLFHGELITDAIGICLLFVTMMVNLRPLRTASEA
jgi:TRAP-type uncharacterized transport system fused permease subunit